MATLATEKVQKVPEKYSCDNCDYHTSRLSQYDRHLTTSKHLKYMNFNQIEQNLLEKFVIEFKCENCTKIYKDRSGLWKHNKTCKVEQIIENISEPSTKDIKKLTNIVLEVIKNTHNTINPEFITSNENMIINEDNHLNEFKLLTNLVLEVVKSNADLQQQTHEMQKQMMEMYKQGNGNTINNNHSNNKTFNLNFFLNEQCKDAMNIMDFVETFHLQIADLERVGEIGFVQGISNIIIDKLSKMDIYKRPIHCSDAKRETMHIKDKGVWEKDNENNDKLRLAVKHITHKNLCLIAQWRDNHPGVANSDHRLNDKYSELIIEAMGGKNKNTMQENETKIIKKISKMVLIDKNI